MPQLTLESDGETRVIVRRKFAAPPAAIYRAHTEAELIRQWMTGPDGWEMPGCVINDDGSFRYDWSNNEGASF